MVTVLQEMWSILQYIGFPITWDKYDLCAFICFYLLPLIECLLCSYIIVTAIKRLKAKSKPLLSSIMLIWSMCALGSFLFEFIKQWDIILLPLEQNITCGRSHAYRYLDLFCNIFTDHLGTPALHCGSLFIWTLIAWLFHKY